MVALRSYVRRAGELFRPGELGAGGLALGLKAPTGWSLRALFRATDIYLAQLQQALAEVLQQDEPSLAASLLERPAPATAAAGAQGSDADGEQLLRELGGTLNAIADRVASVPIKDWTRPARLGEQRIDAHELLREAVAFGRTALDELAATASHLRRAPE